MFFAHIMILKQANFRELLFRDIKYSDDVLNKSIIFLFFFLRILRAKRKIKKQAKYCLFFPFGGEKRGKRKSSICKINKL